jgi:predicted AAA+ superfamily ATPase
LQCKQLAAYHQLEYRFSYLKTKDDAEIDLIVERPGLPTLFIEIKSTEDVKSQQLTSLPMLAKDFGNCEAICLSRDPYPKQLGSIKVLPWRDGIKHYFTSDN